MHRDCEMREVLAGHGVVVFVVFVCGKAVESRRSSEDAFRLQVVVVAGSSSAGEIILALLARSKR